LCIEEPSHEEDLQRKLELKLKKIEVELKNESKSKAPAEKVLLKMETK
jgi:hypothetical protein